MRHAAARVHDPRIRKAKYVGHKGWVTMDAEQIDDWADVAEMIQESYGLIAPKKSLAKLEPRQAAPRKHK